MKIELLPHQKKAIQRTENFNRVAYYHDMGLGKTFTGSEKLMSYKTHKKLIICQKSKLPDWIEHMNKYYSDIVYDLSDKDQFYRYIVSHNSIGVINYDLVFRRPDIAKLHDFSLLLDESSLIQNSKAKRTKFILKLNPDGIVLLSGTPVGGKYENLYSQLKLLGIKMTNSEYWSRFIKYRIECYSGFPCKIPYGYKNVDELISLLNSHGADFLKSDEVIDLPEQVFYHIDHGISNKYYDDILRDKYTVIDGKEFIADNPLKRLLYLRICCGAYNAERLNRFSDLLESTDNRIVVFYNFNAELDAIIKVCDKPYSIVNGQNKNIDNFVNHDNGVVFVQYQSGAMGLNLQKANIIIYYSLPLSSELYEQSKKRIHRIGQKSTCFYYIMRCKKSVEEHIEKTLNMRRDYTDRLFEQYENEREAI